MEVSHQNCRLCLSMTDFKISLFGSFSRNSNLREKILVCMKINVDEGDNLTFICYKCAENVEKFYNFFMNIKNCQEKIQHSAFDRHNVKSEGGRRHVTSYVREQVVEADYTFSFLDISNNEDVKDARPSSPVFSYFTPKNDLYTSTGKKWKTPMRISDSRKTESRKHKIDKPKQLSRDIFESQSQDIEEDCRSLDWKLTPDDFILKKVREKCFGRLEF